MLKRLGDVRLDFLDQMRALAILSVIIMHFHSPWLPGGGIGVGIFFALSGFLIATILLEQDHFSAAAAGKFMIRRFMRIYPAYLVAVLLNVTLTHIYQPEKWNDRIAAVPGILTFMKESHELGYAFLALWTLQIEMAFYLIIPIAMLLLGRRRGLLTISCLMVLLSVLAIFGFSTASPLQIWSGTLAAGALVSLAWKVGWLSRWARGARPLALASLVGIGVLLFFPGDTGPHWMIEVMSASVCGCGLIVAFLLDPALPVLPGLPWLGRISYSIYLFHGLVLDFRIFPDFIFNRIYRLYPSWDLGLAGSFLFATMAISICSYYGIEKPGIRAGKSLTLTMFKRGQPATSLR